MTFRQTFRKLIPAAGIALVSCGVTKQRRINSFALQSDIRASEDNAKRSSSWQQVASAGRVDQSYVISWKEYFMGIAVLSAKRSKDPRWQVGACVVNEDQRIVGIGYNGMPLGCSDSLMPWGKGDDLENKLLYVCHAEMNSIVNKNPASVRNCTLYVTRFPCNECTKIIIQSGVKKIIYLSDPKPEGLEYTAAKRMLDMAQVKHEDYDARESRTQIVLDYVVTATSED